MKIRSEVHRVSIREFVVTVWEEGSNITRRGLATSKNLEAVEDRLKEQVREACIEVK